MSASGNGSNATSGPTHRRSSSAGSLPPSAARRGVTSASLRQAPTPTPTPARDDSSVTRTTPSKVAPSHQSGSSLLVMVTISPTRIGKSVSLSPYKHIHTRDSEWHVPMIMNDW
jgi:hypothetical protein